jgi:tetratricopeptide (TPR) repeat protein
MPLACKDMMEVGRTVPPPPLKLESIVPEPRSKEEQEQESYMAVMYSKSTEYIRDKSSSLSARGVEHRSRQHFLQKIKEANHTLDRISPHTHSYFAALTSRAYAWSRLGEVSRAMEDYSECLALDPRSAATYFNRAHLKARSQDLGGAIADLDQAIRLDPADERYLLNRSQLYRQRGDYLHAMGDIIGQRSIVQAADRKKQKGKKKKGVFDFDPLPGAALPEVPGSARRRRAASPSGVEVDEELRKERVDEVKRLLATSQFGDARALAR